jgi:hypothetical protein
MENTVTITQEEKEAFEFLNDLRRDGSVNMFGAAPVLAEEFGLEKREARTIVTKWMDNFNENGYDDLVVSI